MGQAQHIPIIVVYNGVSGSKSHGEKVPLADRACSFIQVEVCYPLALPRTSGRAAWLGMQVECTPRETPTLSGCNDRIHVY